MIPKPPSQKLYDLLSGKTKWDEAEESIRSWAQFEIYRGAERILRLSTKEKRREMLDRIPASIRPRIEAETMRIWEWHRAQDR